MKIENKENCERISFRLAKLMCLVLAFLLLATPARAEMGIEVHDLTFGEVGKNEFVAGQAVLMREPIWWESDEPWEITVECLDNNLGISNDGSYVKPLKDLQFRLSEDSQWTRLRRDPELLKQSNQTGEGQFTVDWRVLLSWRADRPGTYQADLLFTILEL